MLKFNFKIEDVDLSQDATYRVEAIFDISHNPTSVVVTGPLDESAEIASLLEQEAKTDAVPSSDDIASELEAAGSSDTNDDDDFEDDDDDSFDDHNYEDDDDDDDSTDDDSEEPSITVTSSETPSSSVASQSIDLDIQNLLENESKI